MMHKPLFPISYLTHQHLINTEELSLDKKYQDSKDSFNTIFERSPFGNIVLSKDLIILRSNQTFINLLGFSFKEQLINTSILQYAHSDFAHDWQLFQDSIWVHQHTSFSLETCLLKQDGTGIWCKITLILYNENGSCLGYGIIEDISKRKGDELMIKKSEANLRAILDNADAGYVLYNSKLRIVSYNVLAQKFAYMLYAKDLVEGNYLLDYFPADRHPILLNVTQRVINGETISYEMHFPASIQKDEKWMQVTWLNVRGTDQKNLGFILASKDITANKLAAAEREKITDDLINRNKAMEQFTNITSHNLRAPVANIIGLAQMIDEEDMDEEEKRIFLSSILVSAKNLDNVINDINDILQAKELLNEVKEKVNIPQLVDDIKTSISGMILKERVVITCNFINIYNIYSIRSYMYSIFYNMILNSIKYRKLDVDPVIILSGMIMNDKLVFRFKDNGKGIDLAKHNNNLFGLYKRFDTTVQGRGLGLFMVKTQIESLGGTIAVESELGKGTEFIVEIPFALAP